MNSPVTIHSGKLIWSSEHWISALRPPGAEAPSAWVSLFHTRYFTVLFFANESSVELDGQRIDGQPYLRDIWKNSIGGDRSSCVFALAQTLIESGT